MTLHQKGFISETGCFNNVHILSELWKESKTTEDLVMQLDISKAFDIIPHEVIGAALQKKTLPELIVQLVIDSYKDMHENIKQTGHY